MSDYRLDYYRRMEHLLLAPTYLRLPPLNRNILQLHSQGLSNKQVATKLNTTIKRVRLAVNAGRVMAGMPKVASVMPRGG